MNKIKPYYINKIPIIQTLKLIQGQERLTGNIANEKTDGFSEVSAISKGIEIGIQVAIDLISKEPTEDAGTFYEWKNTEEETPDSSRHIIVADGAIISKYAYYSKPKNKWYTDWHCDTEIPTPRMWTEMPDVPEESIIGDCCCG